MRLFWTPKKPNMKVPKIQAEYSLFRARAIDKEETIRRKKATEIKVLKRKLLRKQATTKKLKEELKLSRKRENNLKRK